MNKAELVGNNGINLGIITIEEYKRKFDEDPSFFTDKKLVCSEKYKRGGIWCACGVELIACALNSTDVEPYFRAKIEHNQNCLHYQEELQAKIPVEFKNNTVLPNGDDNFAQLLKLISRGSQALAQQKDNGSLQKAESKTLPNKAKQTLKGDEEIKERPPHTLPEYYKFAFMNVGVEDSFKEKIIYPDNIAKFRAGSLKMQDTGLALVRAISLQENEKKEILKQCGIKASDKGVLFLQDSFLPSGDTIIFALSTVKKNVFFELLKNMRPKEKEEHITNHFLVFSHDWETYKITTEEGKSRIVVVGSILTEKQFAKLSQKFIDYALSSYIYDFKK